VHLGVSVEDQQRAELRIPVLLDTSAAVRFLSCEPLIGPVDLVVVRTGRGFPLTPLEVHVEQDTAVGSHPISWVIIGGESGPGARPCDPESICSLVKQCQASGVPVFVKQLGSVWARKNGYGGKGGLPEQWPEDLRIRQFPPEVAS
jgi:protein gp37